MEKSLYCGIVVVQAHPDQTDSRCRAHSGAEDGGLRRPASIRIRVLSVRLPNRAELFSVQFVFRISSVRPASLQGTSEHSSSPRSLSFVLPLS